MQWRIGLGMLFVLAVAAIGFAVGRAVDAGWPEEAGGRWDALAGYAAIVTAAVAVVGLFGVFLAVAQLRAGERDERLRNQPYLRVDVGFDRDNDPTFKVPVATTMLERELVRMDDDMLQNLRIAESRLGNPRRLMVWITNQQESSVGHAQRVTVRLELDMAWKPTPTGAAEMHFPLEIRLAYLAPRQTTAVDLVGIGDIVASLTVLVSRVTYGSVVRNEVTGAYGALQLWYDAVNGEVRNERVAL